MSSPTGSDPFTSGSTMRLDSFGFTQYVGLHGVGFFGHHSCLERFGPQPKPYCLGRSAIAMSIRRYFLLSLLLAVLAIGLDMAGMSQYSHGARIRARAVVSPGSDRSAAEIEAQAYRSRGTFINVLGLMLALSSLWFVVASARKHEPAWRPVIIALLIFYVMLQFALT